MDQILFYVGQALIPWLVITGIYYARGGRSALVATGLMVGCTGVAAVV